MAKLDYKKVFKELYAPPMKSVVELRVPPLRYLMMDGQGDPNSSPEYRRAVECLYPVAYAIKFAVKRAPGGVDYTVMPLEGLWWADDLSAFTGDRRAEWRWTMMIMQPPEVTEPLVEAAIATRFAWASPPCTSEVTEPLVEAAIAEVQRKKQLGGLERLHFETFDEGLCAQTMHLGPFTEEGPTIARVHDFIAERGVLRGKHHEIYLSDVRRADPSRWKTVIRQPMEGQPHRLSGRSE